MTLLEVSFGITLLAVGLLASSRAIMQTSRVSETVREVSLATLHATPLDDVFVLFNDNEADDPGGAGTASGSGWDITGLDSLPNDPDGLTGEILFPTAGAGLMVREDVANPIFGTPRDLNGDGLVDGADHSADYRILPVVVRVRWRGVSGPGNVEFRTVLGNF